MHNLKSHTIQIIGLLTLIFMLGMIVVLKRIATWQAEKDGFRLNLEIGYLSNISKDAPVKLNGGIEVGYVEKIFQKNLKTYIRVFLNKTMQNKIPKNKNTIFALFSESLMGPKYVNLALAQPQKDDIFLQNNDTWLAIEPASLDKIMLSFSRWFSIGKKNKYNNPDYLLKAFKHFLKKNKEISQENKANLLLLIKNANLSLHKITNTITNVRKNVRKVSRQYNIDSAENKENLQKLLKEVQQVVKHAKVIQHALDSSKGSLGKWIHKKEFYTNLNQTTSGAKALFTCFKKRPYILFEKKGCGHR